MIDPMPLTRQELGGRLPHGMVRCARRAHTLYRTSTASLRALPTYLVIGAQRCGTTSLYEYVCAHPSGCRARGHEVHYFTLNSTRGLGWYRGHFPTLVEFNRTTRREGAVAVGEASPYYLFHPLVPERVRSALPDVRLIVLLRDPVARAYSHYQREVAVGAESLSFEEALDAEPGRLAGEEERLKRDAGYNSFAHRNFSYVARGLYAEQLRRWFALFPRDQVLMLRSENLAGNPVPVMREVFAFLGLRPHPVVPLPRFSSSGSYSPMAPDTRDRLAERFGEPNRELAELLGWDGIWAEQPARA
jgi:hypothetical protein